MRRLLLVLALLAVGTVPAAHATSGSGYAGRCRFSYVPDALTGNSREAVVYAAVVLYGADPAAGPVSGEVTCEMRGDQWYEPQGVSARGTGAVLVAGRPRYVPWDASTVTICTIVDFDDATPTVEECVPTTTTEVPPREVREPVYGALDDVFEQADPAACSAFAALVPGVPGVDVTADGDVYAWGQLVWDCPPYGAPEPPYGPRSIARGQCHADHLTSHLTTTGGSYSVDLTAAVVVYSPDPWRNPVTATVACRITVNGQQAAATSATGTGVVAHRDEVSFTAAAEDTVALCTRVTFADGSPESERCTTASTQVPPQQVFDALTDALRAPDAVACPAFVALAGTYGPVTVTAQGDVYVAGEPQWDCPPYDIWPPA